MTDHSCRVHVQSDEAFCSTCGLRWEHRTEEKPPCRAANEDVDNVAMAINGPFRDAHIGHDLLMELRRVRWWGQTSESERAALRESAKAALRAMGHKT